MSLLLLFTGVGTAPSPPPEFGWYQQASPSQRPKPAPPKDSFVSAPFGFSAVIAPPIGWFEPFTRQPPALKGPASSVTPTPFVQTLTTEIGWFEPYTRQPPALKGPASTVAMDPQEIAAAPTLTTSIGWFEPYAKRPPETKGPGSSTAWDPQPIAAAPTLTTSIGWFEPFGRPPAKPRQLLNAWVSVFGFRPDLGLGWFEPYAQAPRPRSKVTIQGGPTFIVPPAPAVTPAFGWYFSFSVAPPRKARNPLTGWAIEIPAPPAPAPVVLPDCGHLTSSVSVGADLIPGLTVPGAMVETISTAGKATASFSRTATARVTVSKGGSLTSRITCR